MILVWSSQSSPLQTVLFASFFCLSKPSRVADIGEGTRVQGNDALLLARRCSSLGQHISAYNFIPHKQQTTSKKCKTTHTNFRLEKKKPGRPPGGAKVRVHSFLSGCDGIHSYFITSILSCCWDKAAHVRVVIDRQPRLQLQFSFQTKMTSITVCQLHQSNIDTMRTLLKMLFLKMQSHLEGCFVRSIAVKK